jgi:phenylacetate-CoA ligase
VARTLRIAFRRAFPESGRVLLNCFALGPWATGMNVSMSLADTGILKSIGPDQQKVENTLERFGPTYRYLVFGYPPFLKTFVDNTRLDLRPYHIDAVVGGEGMSEHLRMHLGRVFRTVTSSYGASDLEINLGVETEMTVALRQWCCRDEKLCQALFGRQYPPMIFQYNPLDYVIEMLPSGELAFTVCRLSSAAPKIRYNLHDQGGVMTYEELTMRLKDAGFCPADLDGRGSALPLLYIFGRSDLTIPFYGAKVYPSDIEEIIAGDHQLIRQINSFQLVSYEDEAINRRLQIALETVGDLSEPLPVVPALRDVFFEGLCRVNQDFREVARLFDRSAVEVDVHVFGTGPFRDRDSRIKNRYIGAAPVTAHSAGEKT